MEQRKCPIHVGFPVEFVWALPIDPFGKIIIQIYLALLTFLYFFSQAYS